MFPEDPPCVRILIAAGGLVPERAPPLLRDDDFDVEIVADADTALRRLAAGDMDVLLCVSDMLPAGEGIRLVAEAARRHPHMRHVLLSRDALRIHLDAPASAAIARTG